MATISPYTFTYRSVHQANAASKLDLKVDVYPSKHVSGNNCRPVLVYFHSGGLTAGSRHRNAWFPNWILHQALKVGFTFLIPDYSLLRPGTGEDMLQDVKALGSWIQQDLNRQLGEQDAASVDTARWGIVGQSAGGYLAYLMATQVLPKPKAVAIFYGMGGELLNDHNLVPKTAKFQHWMPFHTNAAFFDGIERLQRDDGIAVESTVDDERRVNYFSWLVQNARLLDILLDRPGLGLALSGIAPDERAERVPRECRHLLPQLCIDHTFPPAYLIHGSSDSAVIPEESRNMAARLAKLGVKHHYLEVEDEEHGFDWQDAEPQSRLSEVIPFILDRI